ncbi:hypothetical protein [Plantactinospora sp. WMMB782]|uniref:hypothetical protein n=1 Tax=Plantactinospora sp. WMMB782 TaxID=3404121 RepID=UPI003B94DAC0
MTETVQIETPEGLSDDARDLYSDVVEERGETMTPEQFGALVQCVRLITLADRAEAAIGDAWIIPGYRGRPIANPLIADARMARAAAVVALKAAGYSARGGVASRAGAALAGARWRRAG